MTRFTSLSRLGALALVALVLSGSPATMPAPDQSAFLPAVQRSAFLPAVQRSAFLPAVQRAAALDETVVAPIDGWLPAVQRQV
jgi:hypothetical protein